MIIASCQSGSPTTSSPVQSDTTSVKSSISRFIGNYVTSDYAERDKGYDWVAVSIDTLGSEKIRVKVRSRSDLKKPTCTVDVDAVKVAEGIFKAELLNGHALLVFNGANLTIKPASEKDEAALYYYCSGGASFAGKYVKTDAQLDTLKSK
ncbi:MAG: hypothetical protein EOO90_23900 [Pedobacter sp.]|nr:MAG: hypothetical protein EOO90_23900 [Pedobacter sp.]